MSRRVSIKVGGAVLFGVAFLMSGVASAQLPSGAWQLRWAEEFKLPYLDGKKWIARYPWGTTHNHQASDSSASFPTRLRPLPRPGLIVDRSMVFRRACTCLIARNSDCETEILATAEVGLACTIIHGSEVRLPNPGLGP